MFLADSGACDARAPGLPASLKLTNTDPVTAWFVVTGDVTPDGIRVVRSVLGAISSHPIVASLEYLVLEVVVLLA